MAAPLIKRAVGNSASTTLASGMTNVATTATPTSTTNFQAASGEGMVIIGEGLATEELAYSTGLSGSDLTIPLANRGLEGGSAQTHTGGDSLRGILSAGMWNDLVTSLENVFTLTTGAIDTTKVVTPSASQTLTSKTLTSPVINVGSDAQGDVYYRNGSGIFTRLAPGTSGHFLKTQGAAANPIWAAATSTFSAYQVNPTTAQTTASTSYVDMTAGTQSVVLTATSHVLVQAHASVSNGTAPNSCYMQVTYDSGGGDTLVGQQGASVSNANNDVHTIFAGGFVTSLAAGTYTFAAMKRVDGGTGTFYDISMAILVLPA